MVMHLRCDDGTVVEAKYETFGCGPAIAAGSMLTEMIAGCSIEECLTVSQQQLIDALGGLPPEKRYCASLAINTMHNALADYHAGRERDDGTSGSGHAE